MAAGEMDVDKSADVDAMPVPKRKKVGKKANKVGEIAKMEAVPFHEEVGEIAKKVGKKAKKVGEIAKIDAVLDPKKVGEIEKIGKAKGHVVVATVRHEKSRSQFRCRYNGTSFSMSYTAATMQAVKLKAYAWLAKQ